MYPIVNSTIYKSQDKEATCVFINRWMDEEDVVCVIMCVCACNNITEPLKRMKFHLLQQHEWIQRVLCIMLIEIIWTK